MDSNKFTGLSMIIAPVLAIIAWIVIGIGVLGGASTGEPTKWIAEIGDNNEVVKYAFPLITVLFLIGIFGLNTVKNSMQGGPGYLLAGFGFFLVALGSAAQLGEVAFTVGTAEAAHSGDMAVASSMFAGAQAAGAIATFTTWVGIFFFGIGILQQKNFTPILGGLMIVIGIFGTLVSLIDYENPLMMIGYLGAVASLVWIGISTLQKE
jgi:hypothetical protein|tara:strand:- start:159 stop:782 length:624 start_codon:yes stop_codon:yes gene_type:complete